MAILGEIGGVLGEFGGGSSLVVVNETLDSDGKTVINRPPEKFVSAVFVASINHQSGIAISGTTESSFALQADAAQAAAGANIRVFVLP